MRISKTAKNIYLALVIGFQFYLAYASTLYLEVKSFSFFLVFATATGSAVAAHYYINRYTDERDKDFDRISEQYGLKRGYKG